MSDDAAVLAVLDRFRLGWEALDPEAVLGCFANDPEIVVIGTDEGEYWRGFDALVEPFRTMTGAFTDPVYRWVEPPRIHVHGDVAWADGRLDTSVTSHDQRLSVLMRTSWVLRRTASWEIVQAHFSVAPAAPVAAY
ncbi:MAG: nuclear transport factor 2 family protein [Chloroflexota bacterium]|nr:nuclear transport factor 2 family protein [Chloroflexota bacterium]